MTTLLFDLDGTLVDSEPVSYRAWQQFFRSHGHELTNEVYRNTIGSRSQETATFYQDHYKLPLTKAEIIQGKRDIWEKNWRNEIQVMAGLYDLLGFLDERGIGWGVVTSSDKSYAEEMLTLIELRQRVGALVTGNDVTAGKPNAEPYLMGARLMGANPADCWVVEDSLTGIMSGVNAGMKVFTMPNPYVDPNQIPEGVITIQSLHDLIAKLR